MGEAGSQVNRRGVLYVVATPIGNLGDISQRALEVLGSVSVIACEDTRQTKKLLTKYDISTPTLSFHAHSSNRKRQQLLRRLTSGDDVALTSDAGTPTVSDPGSDLVREARTAGIEVVAIPGPSAVTAALSVAGLGADRFTFLGFLPHKKGRQTMLRGLAEHVQPVVLYESPHRLCKLLDALAAMYPEREIIVCREMTKRFEEVRVGTAGELVEWYQAHPPKGEVTIIVKL